jgi:hypothetical protein
MCTRAGSRLEGEKPMEGPVRRIYLLLCGSLFAQSLGQTAVFAAFKH